MKTLFPNYNSEHLCKCGEEIRENQTECIICNIINTEKRLEEMVKNSVPYRRDKK